MRRRADHLVIFSIDGLRPRYYLDPRWPAPTLRALMHDGAHARAVRPVFPSLTYPGHTTIVTGALPVHHGICHDRVFDPCTDHGAWYSSASAIRVPTLWDAVHDAGGTVAAITWPVTVGARIDWNIPDVWPGGGQQAAVDAMRASTSPAGLLEEIEREATGALSAETFGTESFARSARLGSMAAYVFATRKPTLMLVHTEVSVQVPERSTWDDARRRQAIGATDAALAQLVDGIDRAGLRDRTAIMVVGDHGLADIHTQLRPNVWIAEAELRPVHIDQCEWSATFQALGGSAFLRVREPHAENERRVRDVLALLPPGIRSTFRIVERDELDALGSDPDAPFALAGVPGFEFDPSAEGPAMCSNVGMSHGWLPSEPAMHTGFIGAGPGFHRGATAPLLPLEAIAPMAASVLGVPFDVPDGACYPGLVDGDAN